MASGRSPVPATWTAAAGSGGRLRRKLGGAASRAPPAPPSQPYLAMDLLHLRHHHSPRLAFSHHLSSSFPSIIFRTFLLHPLKPPPPLPYALHCLASSDSPSHLQNGSVDTLFAGRSIRQNTQVDVKELLESPSTPDVSDDISLTGGAFDFFGATEPLIQKPLGRVKSIVIVRHGLSCWNEDGRIQGSSDLSILSRKGIIQAVKCKEALENRAFDQCFASPISRAKSTAELIWEGRAGPLVFLDSLKEAHLHFLEGMRNEDAKARFPDLYSAWREDPANFQVEGVYPIVNLWDTARKAWSEILSAKGQSILVVTHKSILRAMICCALGMGPERFRAIDINNGGICMFKVNEKGEPMLQNLNMITHLHRDSVRY